MWLWTPVEDPEASALGGGTTAGRPPRARRRAIWVVAACVAAPFVLFLGYWLFVVATSWSDMRRTEEIVGDVVAERNDDAMCPIFVETSVDAWGRQITVSFTAANAESGGIPALMEDIHRRLVSEGIEADRVRLAEWNPPYTCDVM